MLLNKANFVGVFVGIESPDPATLIAIRKKQNTRRSIAQSIHKIYSAGLFVTAGFIVGFDSDTQSMADAMVELTEEAAIPICMVGLLYALRIRSSQGGSKRRAASILRPCAKT